MNVKQVVAQYGGLFYEHHSFEKHFCNIKNGINVPFVQFNALFLNRNNE